MELDLLLFMGVGLAVLAGCLVPNRWLPPLPNDKVMHFVCYALLSVLALQLAGDDGQGWHWLLGLLVAGWLIECLQVLVPGRSFCWYDLAANCAGISVVAAAAQAGMMTMKVY